MSDDAPKAGWVEWLPHDQPDQLALARIVEQDGGRDEAENTYYEWAADPDFARVEAAQRRFRGQYYRRLRRRGERARHSK